MDSSKKSRIDQWVEDALYKLLEDSMNKRQITPTDAASMAPLLQMYQAIQLENISGELDSLWRLLEGGNASITVNTMYSSLDVNVKQMPQDDAPQPKKGR